MIAWRIDAWKSRKQEKLLRKSLPPLGSVVVNFDSWPDRYLVSDIKFKRFGQHSEFLEAWVELEPQNHDSRTCVRAEYFLITYHRVTD